MCFMKKINYGRRGGGPHQDEGRRQKIRASMWWTVTGVSWTNQGAGMTGPGLE